MIAYGGRSGKSFSLIAWIWALSLVVAPLLYISCISFLSRGTYGGMTTPWTLSQYEQIFSKEFAFVAWLPLIRSVTLSLVTTIGCAIVAYPVALFLVFKAGKWKGALFFLLIVPFWTNFLIRTYAWMVILSDEGWLNHFLSQLGFGPTTFRLLFTPQAVYLGMFYNFLPYMAMSLFVNLDKMDKKLLEAAADLGAGPLRRFFKITLPLSLPGLAAGSIMIFIPALGEFVIPDILGGGTTIYIGNMLVQQILVVRHWPLGAALSVILMIIMMIGMYFFEKGSGEKGDGVWV